MYQLEAESFALTWFLKKLSVVNVVERDATGFTTCAMGAKPIKYAVGDVYAAFSFLGTQRPSARPAAMQERI